MNITLESISETEKQVKVEVSLDKVKQEKAAICKDLAKNTNIPGFRAGKTPQNLIEARFKQEIQNEIIRKFFPEAYQKVVKENNLHPIDEPLLTEINFAPQGPLTFTASITVSPKIELPQYKGIKLSKTKTVIEEQDIDNVLNDLQQKNAQFEIIKDKALEIGDYASIDFEGVANGEIFEQQKDAFFKVTEDAFIENFSKKITGMKEGEKRSINLTLPENYGKSELANKEVTFNVSLNAIKEQKLPELNDDFAKELGDCETIAEFKGKIREKLTEMKDSIENFKMQDQAIDYLIDKTTFELPKTLVEREKNRLLSKIENKEPGEKVIAESQKKAEKQVKTFFILSNIIEKEAINVQEEDLEKKYIDLANRYFYGNVAQVKKFYSDESKVEDLKYSILEEKALQLLVDNGKITEESPK